jgi:hypothetical protein
VLALSLGLQRDAHGGSGSATATVYVPADGLVFRSLDGRPLGRLSRDANGAVLELYDDREHVTARLPPLEGCAPESSCLEVDPWTKSGTPQRLPVPGPGF